MSNNAVNTTTSFPLLRTPGSDVQLELLAFTTPALTLEDARNELRNASLTFDKATDKLNGAAKETIFDADRILLASPYLAILGAKPSTDEQPPIQVTSANDNISFQKPASKWPSRLATVGTGILYGSFAAAVTVMAVKYSPEIKEALLKFIP